MDEDATVTALLDAQQRFSSAIGDHNGQLMDRSGDSILACFDATIDALNAAREAQRAIAEANAQVASTRRLQFRVGIHVGDIVPHEQRAFGTTINVAARIQSEAPAGGICLSESAFLSCKPTANCRFDYFRELADGTALPGIRLYLARDLGSEAIADTTAFTKLHKGDHRPLTVAVVPFESAGVPEYLIDGLTVDLVNALARFRSLMMVSVHTSLEFKQPLPDAVRRAQHLGIRFLVVGTIRQYQERIRVTTQVLDAETEIYAWSDYHDTQEGDLLELNDNLVGQIVGSLVGHVEQVARIRPGGLDNHGTWVTELLKGKHFLYRMKAPSDTASARLHLSRVTASIPSHAGAHAGAGLSYLVDLFMGWQSPENCLPPAASLVERALACDPTDSTAWWVNGQCRLWNLDFAAAEAHSLRALELNPNDSDAIAATGFVMACRGRTNDAVQYLEDALARNPLRPHWYLWMLCVAYLDAGRIRDAWDTMVKVPHPNAPEQELLSLLEMNLGESDTCRDIRFSARSRSLRDGGLLHRLPYENR